MSERLQQEVALLRQFYPDLEYRAEAHWVRLPRFPVPAEGGWDATQVAVAFQFPAGYPGQKPYGFYVAPPLQLKDGRAVQSVTSSAEPPWPGPWLKFSWDAPSWHATADLGSGSNMLNYVLTFAERFRQGA
jgi:Prokaryotic E2 family E